MLDRFNKILIPLDFTEKNVSLLETALELAKVNRADIYLLHVVEPIDLLDDDVDDFIATLREKAEHQLRIRAQPFVDAKLNVISQVLSGKRAKIIAEYEDQESIDLIVMNSHPLNPADRDEGGLASLSYQVALLSRCPILLIK